MLEGHTHSDRDFTLEAAAILSIRGARQMEEGGYQFTRDLKVKAVRGDGSGHCLVTMSVESPSFHYYQYLPVTSYKITYFSEAQVATALLGRLCLHPPVCTQAWFKGCRGNVGGSLWLIPINAQ